MARRQDSAAGANARVLAADSLGLIVAEAQSLLAERPVIADTPKRHMTRWLDPIGRRRNDRRQAHARKHDDRDTHVHDTPPKFTRYEADETGAFGFDYVADVGDAFDPRRTKPRASSRSTASSRSSSPQMVRPPRCTWPAIRTCSPRTGGCGPTARTNYMSAQAAGEPFCSRPITSQLRCRSPRSTAIPAQLSILHASPTDSSGRTSPIAARRPDAGWERAYRSGAVLPPSAAAGDAGAPVLVAEVPWSATI